MAQAEEIQKEFARWLREVHIHGGAPSLRQLEARTVEAGYAVSRSSLSNMLNGVRFPTWKQTEAFVKATNADGETATETARRWREAALLLKEQSSLRETEEEPSTADVDALVQELALARAGLLPSRRQSQPVKTALCVGAVLLVLAAAGVVWWNAGHPLLDLEGPGQVQSSPDKAADEKNRESTDRSADKATPSPSFSPSPSPSPSIDKPAKPTPQHKLLSELTPDSSGDLEDPGTGEARIGGHDYPDSLWKGCGLADGVSVTDYSLASEYTRFTTTVGIKGEDGAVGTFGLKADGKEIGSWTATRDRVKEIDVDVTGVERLTLTTVDRQGDPLYCTVDSFIWGDPTLTTKG